MTTNSVSNKYIADMIAHPNGKCLIGTAEFTSILTELLSHRTSSGGVTSGEVVETPITRPLPEDPRDPAWIQLLKLFKRHNHPEPPVRLRDELVTFMTWAWYGQRTAALSSLHAQPEGEKLGRFDHHPDPAIDFEIEVQSLEARLFDAKGGISKPGTNPEAVSAVLVDIERAMSFRVGADPSAVSAKQALRTLEAEAKAAPAQPQQTGSREAVASDKMPGLAQSGGWTRQDLAEALALRDNVLLQRINSSLSPPAGAETVEASCPGCNGTGDQGGNPSYGACDDCSGSGRVSQPLPSPPEAV